MESTISLFVDSKIRFWYKMSEKFIWLLFCHFIFYISNILTSILKIDLSKCIFLRFPRLAVKVYQPERRKGLYITLMPPDPQAPWIANWQCKVSLSAWLLNECHHDSTVFQYIYVFHMCIKDLGCEFSVRANLKFNRIDENRLHNGINVYYIVINVFG